MSESIKHAALGLLSALTLALIWGIIGKAAFTAVTML
jgi:hypothetical protein